jgi:hypothetical protein
MITMNTTKTFTFLVAAVLAMPVLGQTSRPIGADRAPGERRGGWGDRFGTNPGGMGGDLGGDRPYRRPNPDRTVTDEQWEEILKFMRDVSPRRTSAYDEMSAENKPLVKKLVTARYDFIQNLKKDDPTLYDVTLEKWKAEDSIFGILKDARDSKAQIGDDEKKALREQVSKLVESNFKEREIRIQKAEKSLKEAVARLDEDKKSKDNLIDEKLTQYLREGARPLKMERQDRPDRDRDGARTEEKKTGPQVAAD